MRTLTIAAMLVLGGCAMGYWPKVEGSVDQAKYQADVRDCQTDSQSGGRQAVFALTIATGGLAGIAGAAGTGAVGATDGERAAIDSCMTKKGYQLTASQ